MQLKLIPILRCKPLVFQSPFSGRQERRCAWQPEKTNVDLDLHVSAILKPEYCSKPVATQAQHVLQETVALEITDAMVNLALGRLVDWLLT